MPPRGHWVMFKGIFDYYNLGRVLLAFGEWKSGMMLGASHRTAPKNASSGAKASSAEVGRPPPTDATLPWEGGRARGRGP